MRPSSLLGLSPTSPAALAFDVSVALRAQRLEFEEGSGEFWHLGVMRDFGLAGQAKQDAASPPTRASQKYDWNNPKWV